MDIVESKLNAFRALAEEGMTCKNTVKAMELIGFDGYDEEFVRSFKLWGDLMPRGDEFPYTEEQRNLHILWELIDRVPIGINCAFSVPFRQIIAKKLFKKCGEGFVANEGCRFNYGHLIEVGDNVSWNHCCYIDSKGGVTMESNCFLTEYTKIFTHSHSESDHMVRTYKPVVIGEYAKIYTASTILPGVTVGKGAIVATGAIVTKDVPDWTLVAGIPAKPMRMRTEPEDGNLATLNHYMFKEKLYQK